MYCRIPFCAEDVLPAVWAVYSSVWYRSLLSVPFFMPLLDHAVDFGHRHGIHPVTEKRDDIFVHSLLPAQDGGEHAADSSGKTHEDDLAVGVPFVLQLLLVGALLLLRLPSLSQRLTEAVL